MDLLPYMWIMNIAKINYTLYVDVIVVSLSTVAFCPMLLSFIYSILSVLKITRK